MTDAELEAVRLAKEATDVQCHSDPVEIVPGLLMSPTYLAHLVALARAQPQGEPEGWQLVPREPTRQMLLDGENADGGSQEDPWSWLINTYKAMLSAAPKPRGKG